MRKVDKEHLDFTEVQSSVSCNEFTKLVFSKLSLSLSSIGQKLLKSWKEMSLRELMKCAAMH